MYCSRNFCRILNFSLGSTDSQKLMFSLSLSSFVTILITFCTLNNIQGCRLKILKVEKHSK